MARASWKWFGRVAVVSALTLGGSVAFAQPGATKSGAVAPAHLDAPKVDVHAQAPKWTPVAPVDRAVAAAVAQILDSMHRLAHLVPPASVAPPVVSNVRPAAAATPAPDRPRPKQVAVLVRPKPVDVAPPTSSPTDARGQSATLLGIEARLPWQKP